MDMDWSLVNCFACRMHSEEKSMRPMRQSSLSHFTTENSLSTVDVPGNAVAKPPQNRLQVLEPVQDIAPLLFERRLCVTLVCLNAGSRSYAEQRSWTSSSVSSACCGLQRIDVRSNWRQTTFANSCPRNTSWWHEISGIIPWITLTNSRCNLCNQFNAASRYVFLIGSIASIPTSSIAVITELPKSSRTVLTSSSFIEYFLSLDITDIWRSIAFAVSSDDDPDALNQDTYVACSCNNPSRCCETRVVNPSRLLNV